jgi:hypothetical protein
VNDSDNKAAGRRVLKLKAPSNRNQASNRPVTPVRDQASKKAVTPVRDAASWSDEYKRKMQADMDALGSSGHGFTELKHR